MKQKHLIIGGTILGAVALSAWALARSIPEGATAVRPFDVQRYLGTWYEIARLDFRFERDLNNTTAQYSANEDGSIRVVSRGFNYKTGKWKEAIGKARFRGARDEGKLKVSFFGPFYSGYNVLALDPEYRYALVAGKNLDYLWILSRETTLPRDVRTAYLGLAAQIGYDTGRLVWVKHDKRATP